MLSFHAARYADTLDVDVLVVGAGFGETFLLHEMRKAGHKTVLYEAGISFRGTWMFNLYPRRPVHTYLGTTVSGYPNMFHLYGPQGPTLLSNGPTSVGVQVRWTRYAINNMLHHNIKFIDPTNEASKDWKKHINEPSDCSLFPTSKSTFMGGPLPGKAFEQTCYAGGLAKYKEEIRAILPGWTGFRVVQNYKNSQASKAVPVAARCSHDDSRCIGFRHVPRDWTASLDMEAKYFSYQLVLVATPSPSPKPSIISRSLKVNDNAPSVKYNPYRLVSATGALISHFP